MHQNKEQAKTEYKEQSDKLFDTMNMLANYNKVGSGKNLATGDSGPISYKDGDIKDSKKYSEGEDIKATEDHTPVDLRATSKR